MKTRHLSEFLLQSKRRKEAKDFNRQALYSQCQKLFSSLHEGDHTAGAGHSPTAVDRFSLTSDTNIGRNRKFARYSEHGLHFFLTLQAKAVNCLLSLCEKTDHTRVVFLISPLLFAKSSPFSGKSRLVFPPSSRASFFSSQSAERDGALPHSIAQFSTTGAGPFPL